MKKWLSKLVLFCTVLGLAGCGAVESAPTDSAPVAIKEEVQDLSYRVILPADYNEERKYPCVYMMPYDGERAEVYFGDGIEERLAELMASEQVVDMIFVFPEFEKGEDIPALMPELVARVDEEYRTIPEKQYRGILGAHDGGYLAYLCALSDKTDALFGQVGAHMGNFREQEESIYDRLLQITASEDKGYVELGKHFFYIDGSNEEAETDLPKGISSIGALLMRCSNPLWQYGEYAYMSSSPDLERAQYRVVDGKADSDFYLQNLQSSLQSFSTHFTKDLYVGEMTADKIVLAQNDRAADITIQLTPQNELAKFGSLQDEEKLLLICQDAVSGEIVGRAETECTAGENSLRVDKTMLAEGGKTKLTAYIESLGVCNALTELTLICVKSPGQEPAEQVVDLTGQWHFQAYKPFAPGEGRVEELDFPENITKEVYDGWEEVVPTLGWWNKSFAASLGEEENFAGYAWYVREFDMPADFAKEDLVFSAGKFDEANEVYLNGKLIGQTGMPDGIYDESNPWDVDCVYKIDAKDIYYGEKNTVAIRMCNSSGGGGWYEGPVGIFTEDAYALATGSAGRLLVEHFESASTGEMETFRIYLPEGYEENTEERYPVLYMLHGINSTGKAFEIEGFGKVLDEAIAQKKLPKLIVVMPDDPTKTSFWMGEYGDMVVKDLVFYVDEQYRTFADREHRYIGGCSMGGAGSVYLGLTNTDVFSGIISFYGAFEYVDGLATAAALPEEELQSLRVYMACGNCDLYNFYDAQEQMSSLLQAKGVSYYHLVDDGGHTSSFYLPHLVDAISYMLQ